MAVEGRFEHKCEHRTHRAKRISSPGGVSRVVPTWFCELGHEEGVEVGPRQCNECPIPTEELAVPDGVEVRTATALQPGVILMYLCRECGAPLAQDHLQCRKCDTPR